MKIAIIGPVYPYRGGIAHYTTILAEHLAENHQIQVISYSLLYPKWLYPGKSDKDPSLTPLEIKAQYLINSINPLSWRKTALALKRFSPDLVLIQWWVTFLSPSLAVISRAALKSRLPVVFLVHNVLPHEERWWDKMLVRKTFKKIGRFIVHTPDEKKRLLRLTNRATIEITPLPSIDLSIKKPPPKKKARNIIGIPQNGRVILFFGIVRPYKGIEFLIEAIAILKEKGEDFYLVVAGEFWSEVDQYKQQIDRLEIGLQVILENRYIPNEEVGTYFSAADVLVAPYIGGTQSGSVILGLTYGLPIISTPKIAQGVDARFQDRISIVPPRDSKALAEAVSSLFVGMDSQTDRNFKPSITGWDELERVIIELALKRNPVNQRASG
jgi:glycosyltransferase involved in cell wall biosynthesis